MTDLTDGERVYAIGDVHGCSGLLDGVLARVRADLAARPHPAPRLVFLGDYVDRGPDSRGVIERLIALEAGPTATTFLLGNHDAALLAFLEDPENVGRGPPWLDRSMGGGATLDSYGIVDARPEQPLLSFGAFAAAFPAGHRAFLERCALLHRQGGYAFAHAGIRPGVPLDAQRREDLLWIREPFLGSRADHGVKVVHGHTIVRDVEHHANRIAVDTGAVRSGVLSCVVLEGAEAARLDAGGLRPLPERSGLLGLGRLGRAAAGGLRRLWPSRARGALGG